MCLSNKLRRISLEIDYIDFNVQCLCIPFGFMFLLFYCIDANRWMMLLWRYSIFRCFDFVTESMNWTDSCAIRCRKLYSSAIPAVGKIVKIPKSRLVVHHSYIHHRLGIAWAHYWCTVEKKKRGVRKKNCDWSHGGRRSSESYAQTHIPQNVRQTGEKLCKIFCIIQKSCWWTLNHEHWTLNMNRMPHS